MIIGVPTEVKTREYRVGMIPAGVRTLTGRGHKVLVQAGAGLGSGITDEEYKLAGAELLGTADEVWKRAEMIFKVKEPLPEEYPRMREGQILYTYLHLAAAPKLAEELLKRGVTGVAYETIEQPGGKLPLLHPMSAVAGRMAIQVAATYLEKERGGKGILLGGVPGVRRGRVVIIGGGIVGQNAARMAIGLGAQVDRDGHQPRHARVRRRHLRGPRQHAVFGSSVDRRVGHHRRRRHRRGAGRWSARAAAGTRRR